MQTVSYNDIMQTMEFNKLVSLVLGFIVLILIFVWISNRVRQQSTVADGNNVTVTVTPTVTPAEDEERGWNPFSFLFNNEEETPTPTPTKAGSMVEILSGTPTTTPVQIQVVENGSQPGTPNNGSKTITYVNTNNTTKGGVTQIPETGAATLLLPLSLAAMTAGIYLRKK